MLYKQLGQISCYYYGTLRVNDCDNGNSVTQKIAILFLVWVVLAILSLLIPVFIEPTGDGFVRGFNRMVPFFSFQAAAFLFSILIAFTTYRARDTLSLGIRLLGYVPFVFGLLVIAMIIGLIVFASMG